ncbi:MAG: RNA methyltransferase [Gammaproteobacteria bacterium]|nr:RNA methyltransferase [Gammaproteobacteria bacterium]
MATEKQQNTIDYLSGFINEERRERLQQVLGERTRHITVVLEDVYQPQNASAVMRTCECFGIQELHVIENLYEYRLNPAVVQGSSKWIDLIRHNREEQDNSRACIEELKQRDYRIIAMDPAPGGKTVDQLDIGDKLALCFGSEEPGLSATLTDLADETVRIPIHGFTRSYNLSVSAGISLYILVTALKNSSVNWQLDERDATDLYIKWLAASTPAGEVLLEDYLKRIGGSA